jgi:hypothetical protein
MLLSDRLAAKSMRKIESGVEHCNEFYVYHTMALRVNHRDTSGK